MEGTGETFDLYDREGRPLGRSKAREDVHRDGDWHRSAHVWIVTVEGHLLFQRRAAAKDTWPGRLDASIGGHYRGGETPMEAVTREAREELGLEIAPGALVSLGLRRVESIEREIVDRELQDIYLLPSDLEVTAYMPDPVELDGLVLLPAPTAAALHAGTLNRAEASALPRGASRLETTVITAADVIPGRGAYLAALARAVDDWARGRAPHGLEPGVG